MKTTTTTMDSNYSGNSNGSATVADQTMGRGKISSDAREEEQSAGSARVDGGDSSARTSQKLVDIPAPDAKTTATAAGPTTNSTAVTAVNVKVIDKTTTNGGQKLEQKFGAGAEVCGPPAHKIKTSFLSSSPSNNSQVDSDVSFESGGDSPVVVKLRNKRRGAISTNTMQITESEEPEAVDNTTTASENGSANGVSTVQQPLTGLNTDTVALLQRTMGALYEMNPDLEEGHDEIRKLDTQLDHLNEYMDKVEERLKAHSDKLMETLKQQREDREKRRRSFHERLQASREEDDEFQQKLSQVLTRVDISKKRQSAIELPDEQQPDSNVDQIPQNNQNEHK